MPPVGTVPRPPIIRARSRARGPTSGTLPDDQTRAVLSWSKEIYNVAGGWLYDLRRQWAINKAVRIGQQYAYWNTQEGRLATERRAPRHRVRMSVNMVHPVIEQFKGLILKTKPQATVMPATNDQEDIDTAKMAEKVIDYHWRVLKMPKMLNYLTSWFLESGSCFTATTWDATAGGIQEAVDAQGAPLVNPSTGAPMVDARGRPMRYSLGQVDVALVPPYQVIPDLNAKTWEEMSWIQRSYMVPLSEIRRKFDWGQYVHSEPLDPHNSIEYQFNRLTAANTSGDFTTLTGTTEWARITETWVRPGSAVAGRLYPDGCHIVECQNYGHVERIPYEDARGYNPQEDWHPYTMWSCYYVGRFWPIGVVDNLWPVQREINRITSNYIEWQRLLGRPKMLLPKGCGISEEQLSAEAGEKLWFNPSAGPPRPLELATFPPAAMQLLDHMHKQIDNVSGQHGPSRGQVPTTIKSGIGVSLLQEQDAVDLGPMMGLFEASIADVGRKILLRVSQYWKVKRLVQISGKNNQIEAFHFSGADLGGNVDVQVMAGSGLPKSKAAQQSLVEKLIQLGLYNPMIPEHRKVLLSILDMGESASDKFDTDKDVRRARFENEVMVKAIAVPPVAWYEDLESHVGEHIDFMKSDEYRTAEVENPAIGAMFNLHIAQHFQVGNDLMGQSPMGPGAGMAGGMGAGQAGQPQQQGPGGGQKPTNGSMPGLGGTQGPQANREQTMGSQPTGSSTNPSMGP